jgi:hypothetical protein
MFTIAGGDNNVEIGERLLESSEAWSLSGNRECTRIAFCASELQLCVFKCGGSREDGGFLWPEDD